MSLSADQRLQLIQWIAALPQVQFDGLVFSLQPPPGTLSSAPAPIGTRAAELLNWAQSILGPGIAAVVAELRSAVESVAPQKLGDFDAAFSGLQQTEDADEVSPYQGLEAFTPETRRFFYGRQGTVELLLEKLSKFNFVPVIGASGSGKSSVVRAGLVPSLGDTWQVLEPIKPDEEPMAELRKAIRSLFKKTTDKNRVIKLLNQDGLLPVLEMLPSALKAGAQKALLVIDQFEEVFTVCPLEDERTQFIDCVTAIQTLKDSPLAIVTTMRADFFEPCLGYSKLVEALQFQQVLLSPLQGNDLIQAIEQPAKDLGYRLGSGLLDLILEDVKAEKNCLPLLEFALTELWNQRDRDKKELPFAAYTAMQRLKGALNKRAEAVYNDDLTTEAERTWAKRICLELVRIGPDVKDTRQRQPRQALLAMGKTDDAQTLIDEVVEVLVAGRLLVPTDQGEIDLTHEALMMGWLRFADWRQEDRDRRRLVQRVRDAEKEWNSKGQDERYLLQGGLLAEVREQWETLAPNSIETTCQFYRQSDEQEKEQVAFLERALAESELREQALRVMNLLPGRPYEASAQGICNVGESYRRLQGRVIRPTYSSLKKIFNTVGVAREFQGHSDSVWSVAFSPNGTKIVSGSDDKTVRLWHGGTWRDWLALCCNRFRYHPLFKNVDRELFISACKVCEEYVWSQEE